MPQGLNPKYISFDCYGTLTRFRLKDMATKAVGAELAPEQMPAFLHDFSFYRVDEVLGPWQPYDQVLGKAWERACKRWNLPHDPAVGQAMYQAVPTWGPHDDVAEGLKRLATRFPLVILSNAMNSQIMDNVEKLGAPFHAVYTAQQAQAYKPRLKAFEYMLDELGAKPEDMLHVSSSYRYDHISARDIGIKTRVYVDRGYDLGLTFEGGHRVTTIGGLADLLNV